MSQGDMRASQRGPHTLVDLASSPEVVFQPDPRVGWMSHSVAFHKLVEDRIIFFSARSASGRWQVGAADYRGGVVTEPRRVEFSGAASSFYESMTPNVIRAQGAYMMAFGGKRGRLDRRSIFLAVSDSSDGPFEVEPLRHVPSEPWEGRSIDLGPGNMVSDGAALFFYSSAYPSLRDLASGLLRSPSFPTKRNLMRFEERRVGILTVDIDGSHEMRGSSAPIPLRCVPGSLTESVFCPGYAALGTTHLLFPACSNYSQGYPFEQSIGVVESDAPPAQWSASQEIRPLITARDLPAPFSKNAAVDAPDAIVTGDRTLKLFFSAMSRDDGRWSILACDLVTA